MVLPKFEDWKAPWEDGLAEGDDPKEKLDLDKLKRFVHGVLGDKERAKTEVETVTATNKELQKKVDEAARANETEADRLKRENDELKAKAAKADEPDLEKLRLKVAIKKGLDEAAMARLVGTTEEEMLADADTLLKNWKSTKEGAGGEGEDEGSETNPSTQPRTTLRNPGDPAPGSGRFDADKAADEYVSSRSVF
jgi:hypothetical protein